MCMYTYTQMFSSSIGCTWQQQLSGGSRSSGYICTYMYVHNYINTDIHTNIQTFMHTYIHTYIHTDRQTYVHANIHTYIQTNIYTHKHDKYIHIYIHTSYKYNLHVHLIASLQEARAQVALHIVTCACIFTHKHDDDRFYYHSWRNDVVIAFGTLSSFLT